MCCSVSFEFVAVTSLTTLRLYVLQCVAVCCSVLQCVAVCRSVFQCVAVTSLATLRLYISGSSVGGGGDAFAIVDVKRAAIELDCNSGWANISLSDVPLEILDEVRVFVCVWMCVCFCVCVCVRVCARVRFDEFVLEKTFSKVSLLLNVLYEMMIELTFENFRGRWASSWVLYFGRTRWN